MNQTYYVCTGEVKEVVVAPTAKQAVTSALIRSVEKEQFPGLLISCNTIDFKEHPDKDLMFVTENELTALRFSVKRFLKGFDLSEEQWVAYRKIKEAIEAFQGLTEDDEL
jgi:hypothetical protein